MLKSCYGFHPRKNFQRMIQNSGFFFSPRNYIFLYFSLRNDCEVVTVTTSLNVQCLRLGHYLSLKNTICFLSKFSKFVMCAELDSFSLKFKEIIFNLSISEETKSNVKKYQPV